MTSETTNLTNKNLHRNPANPDFSAELPGAQVTESVQATQTPASQTQAALKIAFITDDPYRAETLAEAAKSTHWQVVHTVGNRNPVNWLEKIQADVALIDLDISGAVLQLTEVAVAYPTLPLIALATPQHLVELQDALLAGAKAFIPFPINEQQFIATVLRVVHGENTSPTATSTNNQIIAVTGLKGGVGRSTIALNLAIALNEAKPADVILVEAHHGLSDISVMTSLHPSRTLANIASASHIDRDIVAGNLHTHSSGVKLLTAPITTSNLVDLPMERWHELLEELTNLASTIVIDTSADPDGLLSEVLTIATDVIIVTEPQMTSLNGAHGLLQSLREEKVRTNMHLVVNRSDVAGSISTSAIRKRLDLPVLAELPDDVPLVTYAINRGIPILTSHPRSAMGRSFTKMAEAFALPERDKPVIVKTETASSGGPLVALRNKAATLASLL